MDDRGLQSERHSLYEDKRLIIRLPGLVVEGLIVRLGLERVL